MANKKKIKIPNNQSNMYPFGGLINQGITGIAKTLGANDKNAQIWGSGIAAATGLIPGMQNNLLQAGDFAGDLMQYSQNKGIQKAGQLTSMGSNIAGNFINPSTFFTPKAGESNTFANGGDLKTPPKTKVKYNRLVDKATGDLEVSQEDLQWLKKYNEAIAKIKETNPEIFNTTSSTDYKATDKIDQTAGVASGNAKADYVVNTPVTELTDAQLKEMSPYLYNAGYTTQKAQKELLDNVYRITGKDIISNDYRPGLRHLVEFKYDEPVQQTTTEETTPVAKPKTKPKSYNMAYQKIMSDNPAQSYNIITKDGKKVPVVNTVERKNIGDARGVEGQEVNTNYHGEYTVTQGGQTNTQPDVDSLIKQEVIPIPIQTTPVIPEKKALGGYMKKLYALGGDVLYGTNIVNAFSNVENQPTVNTSATPYYSTADDYTKMQKLGVNPETTLVYHPNLMNPKSVTIDPYKTEEQRQAAMNKVILPTGKKTSYAMGGGLTEYKGGGSHEENPNGGINIGNNASVEEGETRHEDYIYSDRIKLPWNKKATFADESKKINSKYKDRKEDVIAQKSLKQELNKLKDIQELTKQTMLQKANKLMSQAGYHTMPDGSKMTNNQMANGGGLSLMENTDTTSNPFIDESSKNYTPEEQVQIQELTNQLNGGQINKQQFDEALASMGNTSLNESHINPAYRDSFLKSTNTSQSSTPLTKAITEGANAVSSDPMFNDQMTFGEKTIPYLGAAAQLATTLGGVQKTQYNQMTPELINLENQRNMAKKQAAISKAGAAQSIRNTAGNSGRALTNTVTSNAAIYDSLANQLGQSYMNEANTNAQIKNQAEQFNTQIQNQQVDANEMNKAQWQNTAITGLQNVANTYMGVNRDQRAYQSNNMYNNTYAANIGSQNYNAGVVRYDQNGNPIYGAQFQPSYAFGGTIPQYDPITGERIN